MSIFTRSWQQRLLDNDPRGLKKVRKPTQSAKETRAEGRARCSGRCIADRSVPSSQDEAGSRLRRAALRVALLVLLCTTLTWAVRLLFPARGVWETSLLVALGLYAVVTEAYRVRPLVRALGPRRSTLATCDSPATVPRCRSSRRASSGMCCSRRCSS